MNAALQTAQAVSMTGGLPVALTIAATATALVAVAIVAVNLRRASRLTAITGGISAASAATVLVIAMAVGGALTQSPAALASTTLQAERNASGPYLEQQLEGVQLPTLELEPAN